jgi:hypothetical protein
MGTERVDFISAYCDRWCERCAFTERCSAYACQVAIAMCGDVAGGIELAVGVPQPVDGDSPEPIGAQMLADYVPPTAIEMAALEQDEESRRSRLERRPINRMADAYMMRSTAWLDAHRERLEVDADAIVREALAIVGWDAYFIGAKVHRAIDGRDRSQHGDDDDDDPVQNDWNGSAKIALISLERSEAAWRTIADATADTEASGLGDATETLRRTVLDEFPRAMSFVRPGFDEPWR